MGKEDWSVLLEIYPVDLYGVNFGVRARHARYLAMAGQTPLAVMLHTRKFQTLGGTISLSRAWGICVCFPDSLARDFVDHVDVICHVSDQDEQMASVAPRSFETCRFVRQPCSRRKTTANLRWVGFATANYRKHSATHGLQPTYQAHI